MTRQWMIWSIKLFCLLLLFDFHFSPPLPPSLSSSYSSVLLVSPALISTRAVKAELRRSSREIACCRWRVEWKWPGFACLKGNETIKLVIYELFLFADVNRTGKEATVEAVDGGGGDRNARTLDEYVALGRLLVNADVYDAAVLAALLDHVVLYLLHPVLFAHLPLKTTKLSN